jgi:hypothetical protein
MERGVDAIAIQVDGLNGGLANKRRCTEQSDG